MRAPFAPPRLSEPRNVDADAQAVVRADHAAVALCRHAYRRRTDSQSRGARADTAQFRGGQDPPCFGQMEV